MGQAEWQVKAAASEMLAFSLRYPDEQLAQAVFSGEWLDAAQEIAAALGCALTDGFGAQALTDDKEGNPAQDADTLLHALRAEATRLFVGAPEPLCSPYEGVWRAADDGVQALLFVNPHSMAVERFCKACGLGRPEGTNEPLDHIATELELLQYLAVRAAGMVDLPDTSVGSDALPGGSPEAAFNEFLQKHTAVWADKFAQTLKAQSRIPFYGAVADLLAAMVPALGV